MQFIVKYNAAVNKVSPETSLLDKHDLFLPVFVVWSTLYSRGHQKARLNTFLFIQLLNMYFLSQ